MDTNPCFGCVACFEDLIKGGWPYKESLVGFEQDVKW